MNEKSKDKKKKQVSPAEKAKLTKHYKGTVRCINATTSNFWLLQYWTTNLLSSQGPTPPTKCVLDNHPLVFFFSTLIFFLTLEFGPGYLYLD